MIKAAVSGCGVDLRRRSSRKEKFPWDFGCFRFQLFEAGCLEIVNAHENSVGGAQMQVSQITILQKSLKFNSSANDARIRTRKQKRGQLPVANGFGTGSCGGKIRADTPDDMAFDAF